MQRPESIFYTSVTGIWQTVWLEPVPERHITALRIEPDLDHAEVRVTVTAPGTSIVMWVPFNERWGQHATQKHVEWLKAYDPTRLVNNASGWTDMQVEDVADLHAYPGPGMPPPETKRASVLGESSTES